MSRKNLVLKLCAGKINTSSCHINFIASKSNVTFGIHGTVVRLNKIRIINLYAC